MLSLAFCIDANTLCSELLYFIIRRAEIGPAHVMYFLGWFVFKPGGLLVGDEVDYIHYISMHVFGYYVVCDTITPNISDMHTLFTIKTPFRPNAVNHLRFNLSKHILRPWSILGKTLGFMYSQKICLVWVLQKINWNIYFETCIYIYIDIWYI